MAPALVCYLEHSLSPGRAAAVTQVADGALKRLLLSKA